MLPIEVRSMFDSVVGMLQLQDINQNEESKNEVFVEVNDLRQAVQIVDYLMEEYEVTMPENVDFYESYEIRGELGGVFTFNVLDKDWSVGFNSIDGEMMGEMTEMDIFVLDLRRMDW